MKMSQCLSVIRRLSHSQGFYGRLYSQLMDLMVNDHDSYSAVKKEWESQNFSDDVDLIMYLEG